MADYTYHEQNEMQNLDYIRGICDELPTYVKRFVRGIQQSKASRTQLGYVRDLKTFFEYIYVSYDKQSFDSLKDISIDVLNDIDSMFIEDYLDYLQKYTKNGKIYTNGKAAIKRKLSSLRVFYAYLYKNDLVSQNPLVKVDMPKLHEKQIVRMEPNEVAEFLDTVEYGNHLTEKQLQFHSKSKNRDLALLTLMLSTGIRISECVGLDLADVDYDKMCIKVVRKGGKEAIVYFSDEAAGPLALYMEERKKITPETGHENALFLSSQRKRIGVRTVENMVKKYSTCSVPLKHITPHKLRSTYGTSLYQETGDIYLVADVLGHTDVNTTRRHYADIDENRRRTARNKVTLREKQ